MGIPTLFILSDQMRGESFSLEQEKYTVGRAEDCDICIGAPTVSAHHCTFLRLDDGTFAVEDSGSTNGSRVNDQPLNAGESVILKNGDIIQLGGVEILFDDIDAARDENVRTNSVITLDDVETGEIDKTAMRNLGNRLGGKRVHALRPNQKHAKIMNAIVIALAVLVVIVLVLMLIKH